MPFHPSTAFHLVSAESFQTLWPTALDWLAQEIPQAWQQTQPTIVLLPSRIQCFFIQSLLIKQGKNVAGIEFWTPEEIRLFFTRRWKSLPLTLKNRENFQLLLSFAAEQEYQHHPHNQSARAIAARPHNFFQLMERVKQTGLSLGQVVDSSLQKMIFRWETLLQSLQLSTTAELDVALMQKTQTTEALATPSIASCLCMGFHGGHWPVWPLLSAALNQSAKALITLTHPRVEAQEIDQLWFGTIEQHYGASQPLPAISSPLSSTPTAPPPYQFYLASHLQEEAQVLVAQTLTYLQQPSSQRIGLVFPGPCPLAREVALLFQNYRILINDTLKHLAPGTFEQPDWQTWLRFQKQGEVTLLLDFLKALPSQEDLPWIGHEANASRDEIISLCEKAYEQAFRECLTDQVAILTRFLQQSHSSKWRYVSSLIQKIPRLPPQASFHHFLHLLNEWGEAEELSESTWKTRLAFIQTQAQELLQQELNIPLSRDTFLSWLESIATSAQPLRNPEASHPYSHVHLISYTEAEAQEWTHLLLTSLTEGIWPPPMEPSSFLSQQQQRQIKASLHHKNLIAQQQGQQGEGHLTIQPGKSFYLTPEQERELIYRQMANLLEMANEGTEIVLTAHRSDEEDPSLQLEPSEFFLQAYREAFSQPLQKKALLTLEEQTRAFICSASKNLSTYQKRFPFLTDEAPQQRINNKLTSKEASVNEPQNKNSKKREPQPNKTLPYTSNAPLLSFQPTLSVLSTQQAYQRRRQPHQSFGEYDYSLRPGTPPPQPLRFSCKQWEAALSSPSHLFLEKLLGVTPPPTFEIEAVESLTMGTWIHQWLASILPSPSPCSDSPWTPWPQEHERLHAIHQSAQATRLTQEKHFHPSSPPWWWLSLWQQAQARAFTLTRFSPSLPQGSTAATEFVLPSQPVGTFLFHNHKVPLWLHGRIDLLLQCSATNDQEASLLIIDYKTGKAKPLSEKELLQGRGLQIVLYGLALEAQKKSIISLLLLQPHEKPSTPLLLQQVHQHTWLFEELIHIQETGCLGCRNDFRPEFGLNLPYPLATLPIDQEILTEKWKKTHPTWAIKLNPDDPLD